MERPIGPTTEAGLAGLPLTTHAVPPPAVAAFSALCGAFAGGLREDAIDVETIHASVESLMHASSWPRRPADAPVGGEWTAAVLDAPDAGVRVTRVSNGTGDTLSLGRLADGTPSVISWMRAGTPPQFGSVHLSQEAGAAEWVVRNLTQTIRRPAPTLPPGLAWSTVTVPLGQAALGVTAAVLASATARTAPTHTCPQCQREESETAARFCRACGHPLAPASPVSAPAPPSCRACGTPLKPGARFCSSCGASV